MTKSNHIITRKALESDLEGVYQLIHELAVYEKQPSEPTNTFEDFTQDFKDAYFEVLIAISEEEIVGIALFHDAYSSWKGRMLYLDDFVIKENQRGNGIGKLLFDAYLVEGQKRKVKQFRWHVLNWNAPAIKFYEKYNCSFDDEWITCKLMDNNLK
ncbi:MAG: GNAT family N-acetyltransferase [Chitinophagales bacterium]|nr:GNAT family N-acetyltransferase [Chitinophagales bacterium]